MLFTKFRSPTPDAALPSVVVLFGWLGSSMKHVGKYAEMLTSLGVEEVWVAIASRGDVFLRQRSALPAMAAATLASLQADAPGRPAAMYCFSNGGGMVYQYFWQLLERDGARLYPNVHFVCSLFDSAPTDLSIHTGAKALSGSLPSPWQRRVAYVLSLLLLPLPVLLLFPGGLWAHDVYTQALWRDTLPAPQLYIYSETDEVTDHTFLHSFVRTRRETHVRGPSAVRALFIAASDGLPSPHCGHFKAHPTVYKSAVEAFLRDAVRPARRA